MFIIIIIMIIYIYIVGLSLYIYIFFSFMKMVDWDYGLYGLDHYIVTMEMIISQSLYNDNLQ